MSPPRLFLALVLLSVAGCHGPGAEKAADSGSEQPADSGPEQPADSGPERAVDSGPEKAAESGPEQAAEQTETPNFILIVVDALRRDHLGSYGYDKPTSPFLDSVAAGGVVFDTAWAHGSQTFNSTASLLTSKYFPVVVARQPDAAPISDLTAEAAARHAQTPVLADSNTTLAEALRDSGYQTFGLFTNPHHHATSGFWQGFESARYLRPEKPALPYARASRVHQEFFEWYDNERTQRPFFAYVHFMDVHNPYRPPRFLRRQFVEGPGRDLFVNGQPDLDRDTLDRDLQYTIALYDAEIRFVDLVLENLFSDLEARGGSGRTFVFVTSDHGDELMDRGGLGHGSHLGPELIHVPLIASGPKLPARREGGLVRQIDLAPTITELAGVPTPPDFAGTSLVPLLRGSPRAPTAPPSSYAWVDEQRSLSTPHWHLTTTLQEGSTRLFDLGQDPRALRDVAAEHPEVIASLMAELARIEERRQLAAQRSRELAPAPATPDSSPIDPEIEKQLEALGYLDN